MKALIRSFDGATGYGLFASLTRGIAMADYSQGHYLEAVPGSYGWIWRVCHYDETGNVEIVVYHSTDEYDDHAEAIEAALEWCDEHHVCVEI